MERKQWKQAIKRFKSTRSAHTLQHVQDSIEFLIKKMPLATKDPAGSYAKLRPHLSHPGLRCNDTQSNDIYGHTDHQVHQAKGAHSAETRSKVHAAQLP